MVVLAELPAPPDDVLRTGYPLLVRGLANLCVMLSPDRDGFVADFVTLEQGTYAVDTSAGDDEYFFKTVFSRVEPLATSRLVIGNEFTPDLPPELCEGDEITRQITRAGERLGALDLLPAAFPIEEILSARDLRHVKLLYGIGGLSYGNVSARRTPGPGESETQYWMSASGVDKSALHEVGRDILLVTGHDTERDIMLLRVPPDVEPRRVSVDAIEHWMIYREHPDVGAILHVHAWIEGTHGHRDQLPVRHGGARRVGRGARAPGARSVARHRRPAQPRPHHHRPQPRRDLRPHRRQDRPQSPDGLISCCAILLAQRSHAHMNLRRRSKRRSQPSNHTLGLSTCRVPGDGEHSPAHGCELGEPRLRVVPDTNGRRGTRTRRTPERP